MSQVCRYEHKQLIPKSSEDCPVYEDVEKGLEVEDMDPEYALEVPRERDARLRAQRSEN